MSVPRFRATALALVITLPIVSSCGRRTATPDSASSMPVATVARPALAPLWRFGEESSRTDPYPAALDSIRSDFGYDGSAPMIAYRVDLDEDGRPDWLVRGSAEVCGRAGCPTLLLTTDARGALVPLLDGLVRDVFVMNARVRGWPVLWVLVGGSDGGLHQMEYDGRTYSLVTTLRGPVLPSEEQPRPDSLTARLQDVPTP